MQLTYGISCIRSPRLRRKIKKVGELLTANTKDRLAGRVGLTDKNFFFNAFIKSPIMVTIVNSWHVGIFQLEELKLNVVSRLLKWFKKRNTTFIKKNINFVKKGVCRCVRARFHLLLEWRPKQLLFSLLVLFLRLLFPRVAASVVHCRTEKDSWKERFGKSGFY